MDRKIDVWNGSAPSLLQFPSGETVVSYGQDWYQWLRIGDSRARNFGDAGKYLPAKGSWSSILLDGTHELITHMRNSTDGKNVGVILCKLALNHRIAPSDASDVDNGWLAEICVPRSSVKVVDGKVKVNLALFDMEGGEDAIVSTGEKNPQKWITVTGL